MFRMIIELDEKRMRRDGLDVEEKWQEIGEMAGRSGGISQPNRGIFETEDSGIRNCLLDQLEDCIWFMKYVCRWLIDDRTVKEDVIRALNEIGVRCCYE